MNKEYTYVEGKVVVEDENGKKTLEDYYDNIDKVLIQENLIEYIELKIKDLERQAKSYEKNNSKHYIPIIFPGTVLATTVGAPLLVNWLSAGVAFSTIIDTRLGPMSYAAAFALPAAALMIPMGAVIELGEYYSYKKSHRREIGVNSELEFLKHFLDRQKEVLKELKRERKKEHEDKTFRTVPVDYSKEKKALQALMNIYFDLGYNIENYYKCFLSGKLEKKLERYYNEPGIELAKEFVEEKGPVLVKKKKQKQEL